MRPTHIGSSFVLGGILAALLAGACASGSPRVEAVSEPPAARRNVVFVLTDDHRYDALGFLGKPLVETPNMDRLAKEGVHFQNAFVTTSLCSPSRASILTGLYMHNHGIVDNNAPLRTSQTTYPELLQQAGYDTAFVGKWHMGGHSDDPRPGFDHWVSFRGQGDYFPREKGGLNVNGERVPQRGYITDELTDYALEWLGQRDEDKPFALYLSHKAVHDNFSPAPRHRDSSAATAIDFPPRVPEPEDPADVPMWVRNQRNSWHGVEFPYQGGRKASLETLYRRYCESLQGVDESLGRVLDYLDRNGLSENTLVLYMGDNGFLWGEHGLIDKRNAYEESMRVPMLARCPGAFPAGSRVESLVANIDVAPTILEACGVPVPDELDGQSFFRAAAGEPGAAVRSELLYEYYWEWNFPQTPTTFALRTATHKLVLYHGIWDTDELFDLTEDPGETDNLIRDADLAEVREDLRRRLYDELQATGGMEIPMGEKRGRGNALRSRSGSPAAPFPDHLLRD